MKSSARDLVLLVIGLIALLGVCVAALSIIPHYEALFAPFGNNLDRPLRWLLLSYRWWALALVPAALLWLTASSPRSAANRTALYCVLVSSVLALYGWWALQPRPLCCDIP